jgi:2-methylcitrate dehydratase PrpD
LLWSQAARRLALTLGAGRSPNAALRREDYESALASPEVRALSKRIRCVVDPDIEAGTNTEEVPSRVTLRLTDARVVVARVEHPRGSPHRRMTWDELQALFHATVSNVLTAERVAKVVDLVARLDGDARPREISATFIAQP